jgi:hypothetical protein
MKNRLSNDDCRCKGTYCKKRDSCLRYTDKHLKFYLEDDFSVIENKPCKFYIKKGD